MDFESATPPDDTGSDTFRRYRYQSETAFPYVLACALGAGVEAVLLEHVEDIAVLADGVWTLIQVKTRDGGRGPWKASDVRATGGGLDSLYRAYRATRDMGVDCVFELFVEGSTKNGDDIDLLVAGVSHESPQMVEAIHRSLSSGGDDGCTVVDVEAFLQRTRIVPVPDTRSAIEARNLRLVAAAAPHLTGWQHEAIYKEFMSLIDRAMAAEGIDVLARALHTEKQGATGKALRPDDLASLSARLTGGVSVLLRRIAHEGPDMTTLAQKLGLGNASPQVVEDAKSLRAQASYWELEQLSAGIMDDDSLEDVRFRLEILGNAVLAGVSNRFSPADEVWSRIHGGLHSAPEEYDRNRLFRADPILLMGELCEMSDQCRVGWGVASA